MSDSNIISNLFVNVVTKVEKMIREKLGGLMYNNGKGELITRTEFLRWKYRNNEKVTFFHFLSFIHTFIHNAHMINYIGSICFSPEEFCKKSF